MPEKHDDKLDAVRYGFMLKDTLTKLGYPTFEFNDPTKEKLVESRTNVDYSKFYNNNSIADELLSEEAIGYCINDVFTTAIVFNARKFTANVKKVIFNEKATIIIFEDDSKIVVKCMDEDYYDPEKAVLIALFYKILGGKSNYKKLMKKLLKGAPPKVPFVHFKGFVPITKEDKIEPCPNLWPKDLMEKCEEEVNKSKKVLSDLVKTILKENNLTISDFSKKSGVGKSTIQRILNCTGNPSDKTLAKLAAWKHEDK